MEPSSVDAQKRMSLLNRFSLAMYLRVRREYTHSSDEQAVKALHRIAWRMPHSAKRRTFLTFLIVFVFTVAGLSSVGWTIDLAERVSGNYSFEDGTNSWLSLTADFFAIHTIEQRDWNGFVGREPGMGDAFLRVTGRGDIGQFITLDGKSPVQVLSCFAFKQSAIGDSPNAWSGFGITYYDYQFNELTIERKEIGLSFEPAERGYGDGMVPYSIGLIVPPDALYAYIWVWNSDASIDTYIDKFELSNYYNDQDIGPDDTGRQNAILNGSFNNIFNQDEFWHVVEATDTVFSQTTYGTVSQGYIASLRMGGPNHPNLVYQYVGDLVPGDEYDLAVRYQRVVESGELGAGGPPTATAGIDFFDANGGKVDDVTLTMQEVDEQFRYPPRKSGTIPVSVPLNAAYAYAWVWVEPSGPSVEAPLILDSIMLRKKNEQAPEVRVVELSSDKSTFRVIVTDPGYKYPDIAIDYGSANGWFAVKGPDGFETTCIYRGPIVGTTTVAHLFSLDTVPTAAGTYEIVVNPDQLKNGSGVSAPQEVIRTFTLP